MQEAADRRIVLSAPLSAAVPLFALRHICPLHQNVYVRLTRDSSPCKVPREDGVRLNSSNAYYCTVNKF